MSERFEQASLEGLDLDERLADLPLRRTPSGREEPPGDPSVPDERARGERESAEPQVLELDLFGETGEVVDAPPSASAGEPLEPELQVPTAASGDEIEATGGDARRSVGAPTPPERLLGGVADVTVHVGVLAAALLAMSALSLPPEPAQWPGFLVFLCCFSFLYHVVPLAFWGQTPGMAWRGLQARDLGGRPLSFGQAGLRWIAAVVTAALLGLPLLLAFGEGGALSDRVTRSRTWHRA